MHTVPIWPLGSAHGDLARRLCFCRLTPPRCGPSRVAPKPWKPRHSSRQGRMLCDLYVSSYQLCHCESRFCYEVRRSRDHCAIPQVLKVRGREAIPKAWTEEGHYPCRPKLSASRLALHCHFRSAQTFAYVISDTGLPCLRVEWRKAGPRWQTPHPHASHCVFSDQPAPICC